MYKSVVKAVNDLIMLMSSEVVWKGWWYPYDGSYRFHMKGVPFSALVNGRVGFLQLKDMKG